MSRRRLLLLALLAASVLVVLALDPGAYLNLATLKAQHARLTELVAADRVAAMG